MKREVDGGLENIKLGADVSTDQGQVDFSGAVLKVKQSGSDGVFVYTNEEESARLARELRKQGYTKPIVGEATIISQKAIELAGDAANGIRGHVALTVDAPTPAMRAFDEKYQREFKVKSDHNGIQGYMVPYIIKAVCERIGKVDPKAFAAAVRGTPIYVKDVPGILVDTKFDANGMMAPIDLAGRKVSNCSVTMQVKNANFQRVEPTKPGTFNCPANGSITRQLNLNG